MQNVTLQSLLEAGCHFGHKAERWHPRASSYIYTKKDGIHIIDLAKTRDGLMAAGEFVRELTSRGDEVMFVATKRQAKTVVKEEAIRVDATYLVERWIGGFLTNWDSIRKNIEKINRLLKEKEEGSWKKYPKHEQSKLTRYLARLQVYYGGVLHIKQSPAALFIIDMKKEQAAVREGIRRGIPIIAVADTNTDPTGIDYIIPANDDAVGSIQFIAKYIADAYKEGRDAYQKEQVKQAAKDEAAKAASEKAESEAKKASEKEVAPEAPKKAPDAPVKKQASAKKETSDK